MRLSDTDLDFMAQAYADNRYVLDTTNVKPSLVSSRVRRLIKYGFIKEEVRPNTSSFSSNFWLVRPTPRGIKYLRQYDAAEVLRALIRVDRIDCAAIWIYGYMNDLGELPEFIAHVDPDIRKGAKTRFDSLMRRRN